MRDVVRLGFGGWRGRFFCECGCLDILKGGVFVCVEGGGVFVGFGCGFVMSCILWGVEGLMRKKDD